MPGLTLDLEPVTHLGPNDVHGTQPEAFGNPQSWVKDSLNQESIPLSFPTSAPVAAASTKAMTSAIPQWSTGLPAWPEAARFAILVSFGANEDFLATSRLLKKGV